MYRREESARIAIPAASFGLCLSPFEKLSQDMLFLLQRPLVRRGDAM